ncbi:ATP-binding protein [Deinococcus sonorensis]|uniref:AAA family ATPase n=2 Tax=Deinococcus sonorensis TaxID=309891 RepID=A0AAU7UCH0_9DEIO
MDTRSRPPVLIGREPEQALLRAALERARGRQGQLLLIVGEAGIGKTRLVDATVRDLAVPALHGPSREGRLTAPYAPFADALRSYLAAAPGALDHLLGREQLALLLPELGLSLPEGGGTPTAFQEALLGALTSLTSAWPAVLVLEDLHWADHATLDLLPALADRLDKLPLLVIGTYRREDLPRLHPLRRVRQELRRAGTLHDLTLEPLDAVATAALAAEQGGAPLTAPLARLVYDRTEGVPLFVHEFLHALRSAGRLESGLDGTLTLRPGPDLEVPLTLDRLSDRARQAAETAAVLGASFDANHLLDLIQDDAAFDSLTDGGVLTLDGPHATFRHALIRDAIYAGIPWARRRTLHRLIAAQLDRAGAPPGVTAGHWLAGQEPERARAALLVASTAFCRLHAYRDAADAAGRALELWPNGVDEQQRLDVLDQLGRCAQACGQLPEAARAWREAAQARRDAGDPAGSGAALRRYAGALELQGLWEQALEARRAAADAFDAAGQVAATEERLAVGTALRATSRNTAALDVLAQALTGARQAGRRDLEARILGQMGNARVRAGQVAEGLMDARAGLALALEDGHTAATAEVLHRLADSLEHAGDYAGARSAYVDAIEACAEGGLPDFACRACMAVPLYQMGDWNQAAAECRRVLSSPTASAVPRAVANAMLGTVLAHRGQTGRAGPALHDALASSRQLGLVAVQLRALWGLALMEEEGNPAAAATWTGTLLDVWNSSEDHYHVLFPMRWAVTLYARLDAGAELRRASTALGRAAELNGGAVAYSALAHALGELAAADAQLESAAQQFDVAATLLRDTNTPFEEASTRLRLGQVLASLKRPDEAALHLNWAYRAARTLNARALAIHAAQALEDIGQPISPSPAGTSNAIGLTARQLEVLRHVALGLTDRAIAHNLHLSPRTVEMHVGRILASLDSHTRAEAIGKAARLGLLGNPTA